jgi:fido (protein-threonine AMPylation protein)
MKLVKDHGPLNNAALMAFLAEYGTKVARITLIRDLNALLEAGEIRQRGKGRGVLYEHSSRHPLLEDIDSDDYLDQPKRSQSTASIAFNHNTANNLVGMLGPREITTLDIKNEVYLKRRSGLSATIIKKEIERITIDLAWKSSRIEGNTYSHLDTEMLIMEHVEAKGHPKEEAIMILNHKRALDHIFANPGKFKTLSVREIENVHRLLVVGLDVNHGIRSRGVAITGTSYRPLDNNNQLREALESVVNVINGMKDVWSKSLAALLMIAYIQPFEDGNKRTSRLIANACLIAHNVCPLSFRNIDEREYKKAMVIFYEIQNASPAKRLFLEQYDFAIKNYFR